MARHSIGDYPSNWPEIALAVKAAAGWRCIRDPRHIHDPGSGYSLTVHHMDLNPANNAWWNLLALCQRCHLHIQNKVKLEQPWMFEHSDWFKPYVAGYYAHINGLTETREYVEAHILELLAIGRGSSLYLTVAPAYAQ